MDGFNGKPYKNGWFGGKTHYFRKHHGIQQTWAGWSSRSLYFQRRQRGVLFGTRREASGIETQPESNGHGFSTEIYCNRGWLKILSNFGSKEFFQCLKCTVLFEECFPLINGAVFALVIYRPLYHVEKLDINLPRFPTRPNKNQRVGGSSRLKFFFHLIYNIDWILSDIIYINGYMWGGWHVRTCAVCVALFCKGLVRLFRFPPKILETLGLTSSVMTGYTILLNSNWFEARDLESCWITKKIGYTSIAR